MSSRARYTWQQGLAILRHERDHRTHSWDNLCLGLYTQSRGFGGGLDSASDFGRSVDKKYWHTSFPPPRGACVVWITNGWGHISTSLGGGYVLGNGAPGGVVSKLHMNYFSGLGKPVWAYGDAPIFDSMVGISPLKPPPAVKGKHPAPPVPVVVAKPPSPAKAPPAPVKPTVKELQWPLVPGHDYQRIKRVKESFGITPVSAHYGTALLKRVKQFERNHPEFGPANGNIGPKEFDAIIARGK